MSPSNESGWLVELGSDPPRWWDGRRDDSFTVDACEAIRFSRAVDAQVAIAWLVKEGVRAGCKATEHGWFDRDEASR